MKIRADDKKGNYLLKECPYRYTGGLKIIPLVGSIACAGCPFHKERQGAFVICTYSERPK